MNTLVIKTPIKDKDSVYYSYFPDNTIVVTGSDRKEYLSGAEKVLCTTFIVKSLKILGDENHPTILSDTLVNILVNINERPMIIFNNIEEISIVLDNFGTACMDGLRMILFDNQTLNKFHLKKITPASQYTLSNINPLSEILKIPSLNDIKINYFLGDQGLDLFLGDAYHNITTLDLHGAFNSNAYSYLRTNFFKIIDSIEKMPNLSKLILGHANCGQYCQEHKDGLAEFLAQHARVPGVAKLTELLRYAPNSNIPLSDFEGTTIIAYDSDGRSLSNYSGTTDWNVLREDRSWRIEAMREICVPQQLALRRLYSQFSTDELQEMRSFCMELEPNPARATEMYMELSGEDPAGIKETYAEILGEICDME